MFTFLGVATTWPVSAGSKGPLRDEMNDASLHPAKGSGWV